jgi:hypothetical protein
VLLWSRTGRLADLRGVGRRVGMYELGAEESASVLFVRDVARTS